MRNKRLRGPKSECVCSLNERMQVCHFERYFYACMLEPWVIRPAVSVSQAWAKQRRQHEARQRAWRHRWHHNNTGICCSFLLDILIILHCTLQQGEYPLIAAASWCLCLFFQYCTVDSGFDRIQPLIFSCLYSLPITFRNRTEGSYNSDNNDNNDNNTQQRKEKRVLRAKPGVCSLRIIPETNRRENRSWIAEIQQTWLIQPPRGLCPLLVTCSRVLELHRVCIIH